MKFPFGVIKLAYVLQIRVRILGPVYTGTVPNGTVPKKVLKGFAFTRELMEPSQTELLVVPKRVHLESRSRLEPYPKVLVFSSGTLRNETMGDYL